MLTELSKRLTRRIDKPEWFLEYYDQVFAPYKDKDIRVLEIGVQSGGSLELWAKYFTKAEIVGVDIEKKADIPGTTILEGNQTDVEFLNSLGKFDIVIDDGGHTMTQQQVSYTTLFETLNPGGLYIIEDMETSFLPVYSGHRDAPQTTLDFVQGLVLKCCVGDKRIRKIDIIKYLVAIHKL